MANPLSDTSMRSLCDIASMAYDTDGSKGQSGGEGRIGVIGGRVVKYNTHFHERLFGTRKSQEMIDGANAVRAELVRIAIDRFGENTDTVGGIKYLLSWDGNAKPKTLLDRKIVAQVVTKILGEGTKWEDAFAEAGIAMEKVKSDMSMDYAIQKLRVDTGLKDLTYEGLRLIRHFLGKPSENFLAVLNHAELFSAGSTSRLLTKEEREVLIMFMRDSAFYGANPSNENNRKALRTLCSDLLFANEMKSLGYPWTEALSSKMIPPEDRKSVLQFLKHLKARSAGKDLTKTPGVATAFVAMLPNGIERARQLQPTGEITFGTWWAALRLGCKIDCPSKGDNEIGTKFLNAVFRRIVKDASLAGLLSEQEEEQLKNKPWDQETKFPRALGNFLKGGILATYEACLRQLKHPGIGIDESEQYDLTPRLGESSRLAPDQLLTRIRDGLQNPSQKGTTFKFGGAQYVNGSGDDPNGFLNRQGGLLGNFTEKQIYAMTSAISQTELHIPTIFGGEASEKSIQVEITADPNANGDMRVIYKIPLLESEKDKPENAKKDVFHEVIFKPDGSSKFVSLKCVDRNPLSPEIFEDTIKKIRMNVQWPGDFDINRLGQLRLYFRDIVEIYDKVRSVRNDDPLLYVDRYKLGVDEDLREIVQFLSTIVGNTENIYDKETLAKWTDQAFEEFSALHGVMCKRWEITQEASKVNADEVKLERLEKERKTSEANLQQIRERNLQENRERNLSEPKKFELYWKKLGCEINTPLFKQFKGLFTIENRDLGKERCTQVNQMLSVLVRGGNAEKYRVPGNKMYRMEAFLKDLYDAVDIMDPDIDGQELPLDALFMVSEGDNKRHKPNVMPWNTLEVLEKEYKVNP